MKLLAWSLPLFFVVPTFASEDLAVVMVKQIEAFSQTQSESAQDINDEWYLYRRMLRFSVSGQVSIGVAKIELTPEIEIIQER